MSVTTERHQIGLTWEAFIELPDEQLRHAELHDGDEVASSLLPGFAAPVAEVLAPTTFGPNR